MTKEQLGELLADVKWLKKTMGNHLAHHWAVTLCLLGIVGTEAAALIMLIVKLHITVPG